MVAVEDPERKEELSKLAGNQAHLKQVPLFLVWLADLARLSYVADSQAYLMMRWNTWKCL